MGLIPNPSSGLKRQYDKALDQPDIRPNIERILFNIKTLLDNASKVDKQYGEELIPSLELCVSKGQDIFKGTFERFRGRVQKHQQDASPRKVARWAIHDANKFEDTINRLEKFVDGLENITKSLKSLTDLHAQLQEEVEEISDAQSLKLLRSASSRCSSYVLSGSSSRRLITDVAESVLEQQSLATQSTGNRDSFVTASGSRDKVQESLKSGDIRIPGTWPDSLESRSRLSSPQMFNDQHPPANRTVQHLMNTKAKGKRKREEFATKHLNDVIDQEVILDQKNISDDWQTEDIPQNQRLLRGLIESSEPRKPLSFVAGDANYGQQLASIKKKDEEFWCQNSGRFVLHAEASPYATKRMFLELRDIRASKIPFISATPLDDRLDRVLCCIEGPPETPYEGGVFWITAQVPQDPQSPLLLRFQTKIYHPNISSQGHICANYHDMWHSAEADSSENTWCWRRKGDITWSLGALLTALCGLLAAPDVDDPLVPEIARTYLKDHEAYWKAAKLYTDRYAAQQRPEEDNLIFLDKTVASGAPVGHLTPPLSEPADTISIQSFPDCGDSERHPWLEHRQKRLCAEAEARINSIEVCELTGEARYLMTMRKQKAMQEEQGKMEEHAPDANQKLQDALEE